MAKWGEGDPRWIVEERPDATNVNNWHWTEKNATAWSKDRITKLFEDFQIVDKGIKCKIVNIKQIVGEASANNRKGKLIFFYEWDISLKWSGTLLGSKDWHDGGIDIPNLSEENDLDDITVTISIDSSNEESEELKSFMYNFGRDYIRKQLGIYIKELKEEYSKGMILPRKTDDGQLFEQNQEANVKNNCKSRIDKDISINNNRENIKEHKMNWKNVDMAVNFNCAPQDIYNALTRIDMIQAFTNGPVELDASIGGKFVLFGGSICGKFKELIPNKKIVQSWRLKQWPNDHYSEVVITITGKEHCTELKLNQSGVPENEVEQTMINWKRYYWDSIKRTFNFGAFLV